MKLLLIIAAQYFGYFLFLIAFLVVAIIYARTKAAWVIFALGAGGQLLPMLSMRGQESTATGHWIVYAVLVCVGAFLIDKRRATIDPYESIEDSNTQQAKPPVVRFEGGWQCSCGRNHPVYESSCICGVRKSDIKNNTQETVVNSKPKSDKKESNKSNSSVSAEIREGEKVCPKCGQQQRIDRSVCWSCGQHFNN